MNAIARTSGPKKRRKKSTTPDRVKRRIDFFRVVCDREVDGKPVIPDLHALFARIEAISWDGDGRYEDEGSGVFRSCGRISAHGVWPIHVQLRRSRRKAAPVLEDHGRLAAISLPGGKGVCSITNILFYPDMTVGAEFNFEGARAASLPAHLNKILSGLDVPWRLDYLCDQEMSVRTRELRTISSIDIEVSAESARNMSGSPFEEQINRMASVGPCRSVSVVLKIDSGDVQAVEQMKDIIDIIKQPKKSAKYERAKVSGRMGDASSMEVIDLFENRICAVRKVLVGHLEDQQVSIADINKAIDSSRSVLLPRINAALNISIRGVMDDRDQEDES